MQILHIYKDYYPVLGGIENHIRVLAEAQASAGYDVTVLVCAPGHRTHRETLNGVRVIKAGRLLTAASMPISLAQPVILASLRADIVHLQSPYPLGEIANYLTRRAKATVISYQSDIVRQRRTLRLYGPLLRRVLGHADRIVASSPRYIETSEWLRPVRDRCTVVPLGIDISRFSPPAEPYAGPATLLFVGRLRYYKGLDTLIRAMPALEGVHLQVVGDGPMRAPWERLSTELGVQERVRFLSEVSDAELPRLYHRANAFVLPANARAEAFGTVLLEAMASGLPCVTTEVGTGTSWVVQDGVTGAVVPPCNPHALAEAVAGIVRDPLKQREMGQAGRARVEAEFTRDRMIQRIEAVYAEALAA